MSYYDKPDKNILISYGLILIGLALLLIGYPMADSVVDESNRVFAFAAYISCSAGPLMLGIFRIDGHRKIMDFMLKYPAQTAAVIFVIIALVGIAYSITSGLSKIFG